jgi:hypothetical protein
MIFPARKKDLMPNLLPPETIRRLTDVLVPAGLATPGARDELLQGIHAGFVASLPTANNPLDQVRWDLATINLVPVLTDGQVPLQIWLENALSRLQRLGRVETAIFQGALDELLATCAASPAGFAVLSDKPELVTVPVPPAVISPLSPKDIRSLHSQLASRKESLRLIEERKAEYVEEIEIPLQLIKSECKLREHIAELERQLATAGAA